MGKIYFGEKPPKEIKHIIYNKEPLIENINNIKETPPKIEYIKEECKLIHCNEECNNKFEDINNKLLNLNELYNDNKNNINNIKIPKEYDDKKIYEEFKEWKERISILENKPQPIEKHIYHEKIKNKYENYLPFLWALLGALITKLF